MNFDLSNSNNKLILLIVAAVALLLALNIYQKQIGKNMGVVLSIVTIVVVAYFAYMILSENKNNSVGNNLLNPNTENFNDYYPDYEHFQGNVDEALNNAAAEAAAEEAAAAAAEEEAAAVAAANNAAAVAAANNAAANNAAANNAAANNAAANNAAANNAAANNAANNSPVGNNSLNCKDLLPSDTNSTWCQVNPSGVGDLCTKNLLNAGHHIGINTQGCSLRNANRGLRSEPPNPQVQVSPWLQTTICPDLHRKTLE